MIGPISPSPRLPACSVRAVHIAPACYSYTTRHHLTSLPSALSSRQEASSQAQPTTLVVVTTVLRSYSNYYPPFALRCVAWGLLLPLPFSTQPPSSSPPSVPTRTIVISIRLKSRYNQSTTYSTCPPLSLMHHRR